MNRINFIALGLVVFTGVSNARAALPSFCTAPVQAGSAITCDDNQAATQQVAASFESKFSLIASDIGKLSGQNIASLDQAMRAQRGYAGYLAQALRQAPRVDASMVLVHQSSETTAINDLSSGMLVSLDEAVRRKLTAITTTQSSSTQLQTDGRIGEQDVIYFALQPEDPGTGDPMMQNFGDVTMQFDKASVMANAYFSLNSFTVGALALFDETAPDNNWSDVIFNKLVQMYRPLVFKGMKAYRQLIIYSLTNQLWIQNHPLVGASLADFASRYDREMARQAQVSAQTTAATPAAIAYGTDITGLQPCAFLISLGQSTASRCASFVTAATANPLLAVTVLGNGKMWEAGQGSLAQSVIRQFPFFPNYETMPMPIATRKSHWFWEVKVPRQMDLSALQKISFNTGSTMAQPIHDAITAFAQRQHWTTNVVRDPDLTAGRTTVTFKK